MKEVQQQIIGVDQEIQENINNLENKKGPDNVYDINETENGFEVKFPGLISRDYEGITVGTINRIFVTKEEAEQAIRDTKKRHVIFFEKMSLEKTYPQHFLRIKEIEDGKFNVSMPISVEKENGSMFITGGGYESFDSWDEAKKYFLQELKNREKITHKPILEIQTGENEKISFSALDAFNPRVAPSDVAYEIPESVKRYLITNKKLSGEHPSAKTYQKTIEEKDWDKKLFYFIEDYLKKYGKELLGKYNIKRLDALTPKQAIELSTEIVINLTRYDYSELEDIELKELLVRGGTRADNSTVQQLLQEGLNKINDPDWNGNGVCRNFASCVKAVFESLKLNQTKFNLLINTYALFEGGNVEQDIEYSNIMRLKRNPGHAWNTFLTISKEGSANAVIVDATWAKKDLESKEINGLDYTLTRMEPMVNSIGVALDNNSPDYENQLEHILSYYAVKLQSPTQVFIEAPQISSLSEKQKMDLKNLVINTCAGKYDLSKLTEDQIIKLGIEIKIKLIRHEEEKIERKYNVSRVVNLMRVQGVPRNIPKSLVEAIALEYVELAPKADHTEIETIYKIYENNLEMNFHQILKSYFKAKSLSDYLVNQTIFENDNLQKLVFEEIKSHKDFDKFFKESAKFRLRMREVLPQLFVDFSPGTIKEDALELGELIRNSNKLSDLYSHVNFKNLSEEKVNSIFDKIRESLRGINQIKYDELVLGLDNYQVIKQYDKLYSELKH